VIRGWRIVVLSAASAAASISPGECRDGEDSEGDSQHNAD
jgi:hypothetical protein